MLNAHKLIVLILICMIGCKKKPKVIANNYIVDYVDIPSQMSLYYVLDGGGAIGRIEPRITDIGWDKNHIIAKRSLDGLNKMCYYIVEVNKDNALADPSDVVTGPMSKIEFNKMRSIMNVSTNLKFSSNYDTIF